MDRRPLTLAVVRQFGIPPETIKDSMKLGIPVPQVYIVPVDRFCRELGPALGVNLAEVRRGGWFRSHGRPARSRLTLLLLSN